jgi:hypothetical protein
MKAASDSRLQMTVMTKSMKRELHHENETSTRSIKPKLDFQSNLRFGFRAYTSVVAGKLAMGVSTEVATSNNAK